MERASDPPRNILRAVRTTLKLKRAEMAQELGISESRLRDYASDERRASTPQRFALNRRLLDHFGIRPEPKWAGITLRTMVGWFYSPLWYFAWYSTASDRVQLPFRAVFEWKIAFRCYLASARFHDFMEKFIYPNWNDAEDVPWEKVWAERGLKKTISFVHQNETIAKQLRSSLPATPMRHEDIWRAMKRYEIREALWCTGEKPMDIGNKTATEGRFQSGSTVS